MKLPTRPETFACHPAEVAGDGFFPVHEPHISANEYPHNQMKSIQIGDLKITLPIIQGGMGVGRLASRASPRPSPTKAA